MAVNKRWEGRDRVTILCSINHFLSFCRESPDFDSDVAKDPPHPYLELDAPKYSGVISDRWILEKLLAMAGVRLAALLNYLFAEDDGVGLRVFGDF